MLSSVQNPRILLLHCRWSKPLHHHHHRHYPKAIHAAAQAQAVSTSSPTSQIQIIQKSIHSREKTARQFAEEFINRLRLTEPHVKSFLHVSETVLNEADEIDRKIDRNEDVGPLAGVLVAVKDNICTADMPSTAGSKILENYRPPFDATAVRKLKESGAIIVGKTNLDEFGMGSTTEGSAYQVRLQISFQFLRFFYQVAINVFILIQIRSLQILGTLNVYQGGHQEAQLQLFPLDNV